MNRAQHLAQFNAEHLRALNRLVFAAEACDGPEPPDTPNWDRESPDSLECMGEETRAPAELQAIGLKWQEFALKCWDLLDALALALDDHCHELSDLRAKAKEARLALIALEVYGPPHHEGT